MVPAFGYMGRMHHGIFMCFLIVVLYVAVAWAQTNSLQAAALEALADNWVSNTPPNWLGVDPCGNGWIGITCTNSSLTSMQLSSIGLVGTLSGDLGSLTELRTLDLSYNPGLTGPLPKAIGNLTQLITLSLVGCGFSGPIPDLGSLKELVILSLNLNKFTGSIPASIGNLKRLYWLDLADNHLTGTIPISNGSSPGLNNLTNAGHFHLGNNQLSGSMPDELFSSDMQLIHLLFENNSLGGKIPSTIGLVTELEVIRLDGNFFTGPVPPNINNLSNVGQLYLSNNKLTGPLPNLTGMSSLSYVDLSNNTFEASDVPPWFSTLQSLTTLIMESLRISGEPPAGLFTIPQLQTVRLKNNLLNGTLNMTSYSNQLKLVDLEENRIEFIIEGSTYDRELLLAGNPFCSEEKMNNKYCRIQNLEKPSYSTPESCSNTCSQDQYLSPNCRCAYPYMGTLYLRAPGFSDLGNVSYYSALADTLMKNFRNYTSSVGSVSLDNLSWKPGSYLQISLKVFPENTTTFTEQDIILIGYTLSNPIRPPPGLGPFFFVGIPYTAFQGQRSSNLPLIIGVAAGGILLISIITILVIYSMKQRRKAKTILLQSQPFASWDKEKSHGSIPQLQGARWFSFNELKQCTDNFSEANDIGGGGYGRVYKGALPNGQLVAIKRAQQESMQGTHEFKTEIELLSRAHHKNLLGLLGFCFEKNEHILVYDYMPNGSLKDTLSGKSGIHLDWKRRLRVALGVARGLAYLHELADPPIVHRDIKSSNILLDDQLDAKVSDFGLCKALKDKNKQHVTTQVKGTMGYIDPEYFTTQQLTDKSDVYSFGVLSLELITARKPVQHNRYIVREVIDRLDKSQVLYGLEELIDPVLEPSPSLKGFQRYVDLAMRCLQEVGADRPTMSEVVKEIESIMRAAGLERYDSSASCSASFGEGSPFHHNPYIKQAVPR